MRNVGEALAIGVLALSLIVFILLRPGAAEMIAVPDIITLSDYNRTAGAVTFVHKDHGGTGETRPACSDCHHTTGGDQTPEKCSACHQPLDASAAPTDIEAFHRLCIGCHQSEIEKGNTRLSLACDSCHRPESQ